MASIAVLIVVLLVQLSMMTQTAKHIDGSEDAAKHLKAHFDIALSASDILNWSFVQPTYIQGAGFAVRYCFEFEQEEEHLYTNVYLAVSDYSGRFRWTSSPMFNAKGACIAFVPTEEIGTLFRGVPGHAVSVDAVVTDGLTLCEHLRSRLTISGNKKVFTRPTSVRLPNEYSPGLHKVYVLSSPEKGVYSERGPTDRILNFSPNAREWQRLMLSLQGTDLVSTETVAFQGLQSEIPRFPLLSRIAGPYDQALYMNSEIHNLVLECQDASTVVQDHAARIALEKIRLAADWAERLRSGLLFVPSE